MRVHRSATEAAILAKLIAAPASSANQATEISKLDSIKTDLAAIRAILES